ncbi:hypothetical protein [uncultured Paraglaciecola sp.]|uniref:hypothetical protein n=1 Tax=uncultured Paraglaciecola sp. TaxID=1765024 RepID=UPI0025DB15FC|nr:hypothetical protein [uncultured Paraglaciecola sp.]
MQRFANDPNKSWAFFKRGLGIFCLGAVVILIGAKIAPIIQIPGLIILAVGSLYSIRGYLGILAHRMTASFKPPPSSLKLNSLSDDSDKDK